MGIVGGGAYLGRQNILRVEIDIIFAERSESGIKATQFHNQMRVI